MSHGNDLTLGYSGGGSEVLGISAVDRGGHLYVAGATGTGKSKFLEHLIRRDLLAWPKRQCGLMVLDPHGSLFTALTAWLARHDLRRLPIVPIDLRSGDWVVSYNPLRNRPGAGIAAVVGGFVHAIAHASGLSGLAETPRLAKWLRATLCLLYENQLTLAEALHLIHSPDFRRQMVARVQDPVARAVWLAGSNLREAEFQEQLESTVSRIVKFLASQTMRAALCQTGASLDLSAAVRRGSIVLVSLATAGGHVDEEDAALFGGLLLSDLWAAAKARGKNEAGPHESVKPFYVYIDEFHRFVSPVLATALDEARGFGLHFTLAHQFPSQLTGRGEQGRLVFNSVMANARSKVVFQMDHPDDLSMLALWLFRQQIDPDAVKHQHYTTRVLGQEVRYMPRYSESTTRGTGGGRSHGQSTGESSCYSWDFSTGRSRGLTSGSSAGSSSGESVAEPGWPGGGPRRQLTSSESQSLAEGWSDSDSRSSGESGSEGDSSSESFSESESWSDARTDGVSSAPMLFPVFGREATAPQFRGIEEQVLRATQVLSAQPARHFVARLVGSTAPVHGVTPEVRPAATTAAYTDRWLGWVLDRLPFGLRTEEALRLIDQRSRRLAEASRDGANGDEPATARRRVRSASVDPQTTPASPTSGDA